MSTFISYEHQAHGNIRVKLMGKHTGTIVPESGGWRYYPKGSTSGGELYATITLCKKSLEAE